MTFFVPQLLHQTLMCSTPVTSTRMLVPGWQTSKLYRKIHTFGSSLHFSQSFIFRKKLWLFSSLNYRIQNGRVQRLLQAQECLFLDDKHLNYTGNFFHLGHLFIFPNLLFFKKNLWLFSSFNYRIQNGRVQRLPQAQECLFLDDKHLNYTGKL